MIRERLIGILGFKFIPDGIVKCCLVTQVQLRKVFWFNKAEQFVGYGLMMQLLYVHIRLLAFNIFVSFDGCILRGRACRGNQKMANIFVGKSLMGLSEDMVTLS